MSHGEKGMKLKIAFLDQDTLYINRLVRALQTKYPDEFILSVFSNENNLYASLENTYVDIVLIDSSVKLDKDNIPENITLGYLSRLSKAEAIDGVPVICKYQKVDIIYKSILDLYAENSSNIKIKNDGGAARVILFMSAQGGSGTSVAAAAYAIGKAEENKRVFYLNLENLGSPYIYFNGDGALSFSDIIYSLKSKKSNLPIKIESASRRDDSGVAFFAPCSNAYDMFELQNSEVINLVQEISRTSKYDEIVIDISDGLNERTMMLMKECADAIIYVSDGSKNGNLKFERFCEVARVIEQRESISILGKMKLLYNRYSSKTGKQLTKSPIAVIGGIHRFEGIEGRELVGQVAQTETISRI